MIHACVIFLTGTTVPSLSANVLVRLNELQERLTGVEDGTRSVNSLQGNEVLRPLARDSEGVLQQIDNKSFDASMATTKMRQIEVFV